MDVELTRESDKLLAMLYKLYLDRRAAGESRSDSKYFGSSDDILTNLLICESRDDIDDWCRELSCKRYLDCLFSDDTISEAWLTDNAIIYLENRFKNGVLAVADFLSKFIP